MMKTFPISIIVPVGPGETKWRPLLENLLDICPAETWEEILLIGDIEPGNEGKNIRKVSEKNNLSRSFLMNTGAKLTRSEFLWFIHADSRFSSHSIYKFLESIKFGANERSIYYFDLKFQENDMKLMAINEFGVKLRSNLLASPFGDQAFFLARKIFFELGQYDESAAIGEDLQFVWKAKLKGVNLNPVDAPVYTSARKYQRNGQFKTTLAHIIGWVQLTYRPFLLWVKARNDQGLAS